VTADLLAQLEGLPEAIDALAARIAASNARLREQVLTTRAILGELYPGGMQAAPAAPAAPAVSDPIRVAVPPGSHLAVVAPPLTDAQVADIEASNAEARAVAMAQLARRRPLTAEEAEHRRFLEESAGERKALVERMRNGS
jgi:hypothetical protein